MSFVATAVAGASVVGGLLSANASQNAASTQAQAANRATALSAEQYQQTREDNAPWRAAGTDALNQIHNQQGDFQRDFKMSDFQADPGYQFRMDEAQKAIERSASARGGANSGATMKALIGNSQNVASGEYTDAYNRFNADRDRRFGRLSQLAGIGQAANSANQQASQNYANNAGQNIIGAGNAQAAGTVGAANAITGAASNGMNTWMNYTMMNRYAPTAPTNPAGTSSPY